SARLRIPDLADHDHVGIRSEHRPQPNRKGEPGLAVHPDLVDPVQLVLDGVLDRDDVLVDLVELLESRVERCRLTGTGRTGDEDGAVGLTKRGLESTALLTGHGPLVAG